MTDIEPAAIPRKGIYRNIITEFLNSGSDAVRLDEIEEGCERRTYLGIKAAIKRYGFTEVKALMRGGEVYMKRLQ